MAGCLNTVLGSCDEHLKELEIKSVLGVCRYQLFWEQHTFWIKFLVFKLWDRGRRWVFGFIFLYLITGNGLFFFIIAIIIIVFNQFLKQAWKIIFT